MNVARPIRLLGVFFLAWGFCTHAPVLFAATGPTVTITNPPNGATFLAHAGFVLKAKASDSNAAIASVDFYQGTTRLGGNTSPPYAIGVSNLAVGKFRYSAVATDSLGRKATNSIAITVNPDLVRPTVSIVSPSSGQIINTAGNFQIQVFGRARDNVEVTNVQIRLNGGNWTPCYSEGDSFADWIVFTVASPGTNNLSAFATDASGNTSITNHISFFLLYSVRLQFNINGIGSITGDFGNFSSAENVGAYAGREYSVTAVPGPGQIFSGWTGSIVSNSATLHFLMPPNPMFLQAEFVPDPLLHSQGLYTGLFGEANRDHLHSGFFSLNLADHGAYTASLKRGTNVYPFSGKFNAFGAATNSVNGWDVTMNVDASRSEQLTGTVSGKGWSADLLANRYVFNSATNPAGAFKGAFTMALPGVADSSTIPAGYGFAAASVGPGGYLTLSGTLADNFAWSQSVPLSRAGDAPCYVPLYGGQGSVWGWLALETNKLGTPITGDLSWIRPPRPGATYYPLGFTNDTTIIGGRYIAPTNATTHVINMSSGYVFFSGGNLGLGFENQVTLTPSNRVINLSANSLSMSINPSNGFFSGRVQVPGTTHTNTYKGAFIQGPNAGYGFILGTNQSGSVGVAAPSF